jgi:hypothetical protein
MQPPLFTKAENLLDCPDDTKARFAAQQLRRPAQTWWDHFRAMLPAGHEVS